MAFTIICILNALSLR